MPTESPSCEDAISGNVIHVGDGQSVAIYRRNGECWVADFQWGAGKLVDAASWFRFHAGVLRYAHSRRAAALQTMAPISPQLAERIERLHRSTGLGGSTPEPRPAPATRSPAKKAAEPTDDRNCGRRQPA